MSYVDDITRNSDRNNFISDYIADLTKGKIDLPDCEHVSPGLVFVKHKEHARLLAQYLERRLKIEVPYVTSDIDKEVRDQYADRLRARDDTLPVIVSTMVWSTGINIPSLAWVAWAGAGQAPIALKQSAGRGSRKAEGKSGFVLLDFQDIGKPNLEDQARRRMHHYADEGFEIEDRIPYRTTWSSDDAADLEELYEDAAPESPRPLQPAPQRTVPTQSSTFDFLFEPSGYGKFHDLSMNVPLIILAFIGMFGPIALLVIAIVGKLISELVKLAS